MGVFRIQLFHLEMAKCASDALAALPDVNKDDDRGFLGQLLTLVGVNGRFSNLKKKIVNNYEWHAQFLKEYQSGLVSQMFDTYIKQKGIDVASVKSRPEVENLLESMLLAFGCNWIWDPSFTDPMADVQCDLFQVSRDQVIRLLHTLAFSQCEHENDFLGLRALRRTAIVTFRSKSSRSKYALYLLLDLVVELSASKRSQARMDIHCCVNASGMRGGYMFRYMLCYNTHSEKPSSHLFPQGYVQTVLALLGNEELSLNIIVRVKSWGCSYFAIL